MSIEIKIIFYSYVVKSLWLMTAYEYSYIAKTIFIKIINVLIFIDTHMNTRMCINNIFCEIEFYKELEPWL